MKNLTIKKVALGLFLAGYAASSAYAVDLKTKTSNEILGNAPVIYSDVSKQARQVTVRISADEAGSTAGGPDRKAEVGDFIHVFYELRDLDGDLDENGVVRDTLKVWINDGTNWVKVNSALDIKFANQGETGHLYFQIPEDMAGAVKVGLQLQEKTTFGNPNTNQWLDIADIWSNKIPAVKPEIGDDDKPTDDTGPGDTDPDNPVGPIVSKESTKLGIFKYKADGSLDMAVNLASLSRPASITNDDEWTEKSTPRYGDRLAAVVWQKVKGDTTATSVPGANDRIITESYSFTWNLSGPSNDTTGNVDSSEKVTAGVYSVTAANNNDSIALGAVNAAGGNVALTGAKHNSVYSIAGTKAGIQGFKLQVTAN